MFWFHRLSLGLLLLHLAAANGTSTKIQTEPSETTSERNVELKQGETELSVVVVVGCLDRESC